MSQEEIENLEKLVISTHHRFYNTILKTFRSSPALPPQLIHRQDLVDSYCRIFRKYKQLEPLLDEIRVQQHMALYEDEDVKAPLEKKATELSTRHYRAFRGMMDLAELAIREGWFHCLPGENEIVLNDSQIPSTSARPGATRDNPINLDE